MRRDSFIASWLRSRRRLRHIEVVRVQPGDVIVYCNHATPGLGEDIGPLMGELKRIWPDNEVAVLLGGGTIKVVRRTANHA